MDVLVVFRLLCFHCSRRGVTEMNYMVCDSILMLIFLHCDISTGFNQLLSGSQQIFFTLKRCTLLRSVYYFV